MRETSPTVLLVEDHEPTRGFIADNLLADGYEVLVARTAAGALREVEHGHPDLVVLDLGLPDGDGLEVLRRVRRTEWPDAHTADVPVLVLSGRGAELDRLRGFEAGADDYLVKPFSYSELRARLTALWRRRRPPERPRTESLQIGPLRVDSAAREAFLRGERLPLSKKEFDLLAALAQDPHRPHTRADLLRDVWGLPHGLESRTLDAHAFRLRRKLARHGDQFVVNVYGLGYRLADGPGA